MGSCEVVSILEISNQNLRRLVGFVQRGNTQIELNNQNHCQNTSPLCWKAQLVFLKAGLRLEVCNPETHAALCSRMHQGPSDTNFELTTEMQHQGPSGTDSSARPKSSFHRLTHRAVVQITPKMYIYE